MAVITYRKVTDGESIARSIQGWFDRKGFENKVLKGGGGYTVKAWTGNGPKTISGPGGGMQVAIKIWRGETEIEVTQANRIRNMVKSEGTCGAEVGCFASVEDELERYIRVILDEASSMRDLRAGLANG